MGKYGRPVQDSMWLHKYGKDNYWTGEKWYGKLRITMPISQHAFPEFQALFASGNASNHFCPAEDALIAPNVSLNPGERQPCMREGFDHARRLPHPLVFSDEHLNISLRGKAKGAEAILRERGLWPDSGWRSDGFKFKLERPKKRRNDWPAGINASG